MLLNYKTVSKKGFIRLLLNNSIRVLRYNYLLDLSTWNFLINFFVIFVKIIFMRAIRTIQKTTTGELTIAIPEAYIGRELEIIILLPEQVSDNQVAAEPERYLVAQQFKGKAKNPDFPTNKYDVYEQ